MRELNTFKKKANELNLDLDEGTTMNISGTFITQ